jgi:hypothetical protein
MLTDWDYTEVQDFDALKRIWENINDTTYNGVNEKLRNQLGLPIVELDASQSRFFKHHYLLQYNKRGTMEIDA